MDKKRCKICGIKYDRNQKYSRSQWSRSSFCSYKCAAQDKAEKLKKRVKKKCRQCGKEFEVRRFMSLVSKFCSPKCHGESKKIKDGLTNDERYRRKRGSLKQHTPEWLDKIRATTKGAMSRPEIKLKISKPKGPMSIEGRIIRSNALAGKMPKNMWFGSNHYPNVQSGDYENSKGTMYFRSKWEANYALYLDFLVDQGQIKGWEYESDVFVFEKIKFGTRSYRPDFKVFNNDGSFEYHEIKGYMDSKSKTKLRRMLKYYPEVKLILVDGAFYADLKKKLGKMLRFY